MAALITTLIDKKDNNEIIRDQIGAILAIEKENQKILAIADAQNPDLYDFAITLERSNPWLAMSNTDGSEKGDLKNGLANVYFESDNFVNPGSNVIKTQKVTGTFILDCYGFKNTDENGGNIKNGDEYSSYEVDRVTRLVRNILMSSMYTYLLLGRTKYPVEKDLQIVQKRYIIRREKFIPSQAGENSENVIGERLSLNVDYIEWSPQFIPGVLETLITECTRSSDGQVLFTYEA